jgi:L-glutamine-phosphate cytidylyltransferase
VKALILAAGRGERLDPLTRDCPKSLLDLGDGTTVLERQLHGIKLCGVGHIAIVTGYKTEQIEGKVKALSGVSVRLLYNPFFHCSDNLVSAWMAWPVMDDAFVLINGDDIFHPRVLQKVLRSPADICMVIDKKRSYDTDDMKVTLARGRVTDVGKDLKRAHGEAIGITKFSRRGAEIFRRQLAELVRDLKNHGHFYLHAIRVIIQSGYPVEFVTCRQSDWAEIDFHVDLATARANIQSKIQRIGSGLAPRPQKRYR